MGLRKRDGSWHYRFQFRGREYTGNTGLADTERNKSAAQGFMREELRRLQLTPDGERIVPVAFSEAAEVFKTWALEVEYRRKPSTAQRIKTSMASAIAFFDNFPVCDITPASIEGYKEWRITQHQVKDPTVRNDLFNLSIFFERFAKKRGWCAGNPTREVTKPSIEDAERIHVLSREEEWKYFAAAKSVSQALYDVGRLMINQGCRPGELYALQQSAVDLKKGTISVSGKTRAAKRTLDLTPESRQILERRLAESGRWVFPSPRKRGAHVVKFDAQHDRVCSEVGCSFVLYDLRHTFATRAANEAGIDLPTLAALLGHNSLRCVMKYVHPQQAHKKEAMERYSDWMEREKKPGRKGGKKNKLSRRINDLR